MHTLLSSAVSEIHEHSKSYKHKIKGKPGPLKPTEWIQWLLYIRLEVSKGRQCDWLSHHCPTFMCENVFYPNRRFRTDMSHSAFSNHEKKHQMRENLLLSLQQIFRINTTAYFSISDRGKLYWETFFHAPFPTFLHFHVSLLYKSACILLGTYMISN